MRMNHRGMNLNRRRRAQNAKEVNNEATLTDLHLRAASTLAIHSLMAEVCSEAARYASPANVTAEAYIWAARVFRESAKVEASSAGQCANPRESHHANRSSGSR